MAELNQQQKLEILEAVYKETFRQIEISDQQKDAEKLKKLESLLDTET